MVILLHQRCSAEEGYIHLLPTGKHFKFQTSKNGYKQNFLGIFLSDCSLGVIILGQIKASLCFLSHLHLQTQRGAQKDKNRTSGYSSTLQQLLLRIYFLNWMQFLCIQPILVCLFFWCILVPSPLDPIELLITMTCFW